MTVQKAVAEMMQTVDEYALSFDMHAVIVTDGLQRFGEDDGVGTNVRLITQYTVCADPNFDSGIRDPLGGERHAWRAWRMPFHRIGP